MKAQPKAIILSGYGLNCEEETAHAFALAGARADIVHINDLVAGLKTLRPYQILAIPGGFSYGDDTGSGKAYANKLKNHLRGKLHEFITGDKLVIGICNGFQILTQAGLLPGALLPNSNARYTARWVDLKVTGSSPWLTGIKNLMVPIAHGEGRYYATDDILDGLQKERAIALKYTLGEVCRYQNLKANPNGALRDIAAVAACDGRVLGMMPHPERAAMFTQLPHWPLIKEHMARRNYEVTEFGPGLQIFKNAVNYFR